MTLLKIITTAMLGVTLLGCERPQPSQTPNDLARLNLNVHVSRLQTNSIRYEPLYCDDGAPESTSRQCHANIMGDLGSADKKLGVSTFSCSVESQGRCLFVSTAEGADAAPPLPNKALTCADSIHPQTTIEVPNIGTVTVLDYTANDTADQAWVSASFTLQNTEQRLTEAQATSALEHLVGRIEKVCRSYPMKKTRVFLYPAGVTAGESTNWIARMDESGERKIEFHRQMLKDERGDRYACLDAKEPGIGPNDGTKLPPVRQREIIGTWAETGFNLTMSLERVNGKVYKVYRSAYCASGNRGELLQTRSQGRYAVIGSASGDYYQVTASGDLGVFDRAGSIDVMLKHFALYPTPAAQ